jgi:hypothetical protein
MAARDDGLGPGVSRHVCQRESATRRESQVRDGHACAQALQPPRARARWPWLTRQMLCRYAHVEAKTDTGPNMRKIEDRLGLASARYKRTECFRRIKPEKLAHELRSNNMQDVLLLDLREKDDFEALRIRVPTLPVLVALSPLRCPRCRPLCRSECACRASGSTQAYLSCVTPVAVPAGRAQLPGQHDVAQHVPIHAGDS